MKSYKIIILSFLLIFISMTFNVNAFGLAVTPSTIEITGALKGQTYERTIGIYNTETYSGVFILNTTDTGDDWITFYKENNLSMPIKNVSIPGGKDVKLIAKFTIPQDAANGNYSPVIYVSAIPENATQTNSSSQEINLQIPVEALITVVGDQILSGEVKSYTITDTEINHPLKIVVEFQNTGNVVATPLVEIAILKNNLSIDSFNYSQKSFPLNTKDIIELEWNTTNQNVGDYMANVKVFLGDSLIEEKNLSFKILERGILTAEGQIKEVKASSEVETGQSTKIEVQFQNTGQIDLMAKITGEIYQDNNLVDTLQGDETLIKVDKTGTLTAYFKPTKDGSYLIKSSVVFEGKKEPLNDIIVNSKSSSAPDMLTLVSQNLIIVLFVAFAFGLIIIGILSKKFRKSTKRK